MEDKIRSHRDLKAYKKAFEMAMRIFEISKDFPKAETYSLTDQIRRSSRSVCSNLAEGFRRRKYPNSFINCLNIAEAEAAETQVWLDFAFSCQYIPSSTHDELFQEYENVIGMLVNMQKNPEKWKI